MSRRTLNQIAVLTASMEPNAVCYRAERDDNRRFDDAISNDFDRCDEMPTNWNWYKYDYRVVAQSKPLVNLHNNMWFEASGRSVFEPVTIGEIAQARALVLALEEAFA